MFEYSIIFKSFPIDRHLGCLFPVMKKTFLVQMFLWACISFLVDKMSRHGISWPYGRFMFTFISEVVVTFVLQPTI